jgi:hypothetical protein
MLTAGLRRIDWATLGFKSITPDGAHGQAMSYGFAAAKCSTAICRDFPNRDLHIVHARGDFSQGQRDLETGVLTAGRRAANSMLYSVQDSTGACIMDAYLIVALICSVYLAGRVAAHRGRSFKIWAWTAAFIGPLALPLIFLFPNLHRKNGDPA